MTQCSCKNSMGPSSGDHADRKLVYIAKAAVVSVVWLFCYMMLETWAEFITLKLLRIDISTRLGSSIVFFMYDTVKILMLLVMMVYGIAWMRAGLNVERVRTYLAGKRQALGYPLAACFGAVTPFCSCSSVPLFIGFSTAGIPLGITMAFLITSPLVNEVAVVLLWGLLGWKLTLVYVGIGLLAGVFGGVCMSWVKAERWLQPFIRQAMRPAGGGLTPFAPLPSAVAPKMTWRDRHSFAKNETSSIFSRVWKWVIGGVALGAALHGYLPQEWVEETLGKGLWWSVPAAVAVGIPLYANVTGIIPVMESLLLKGMPIGTTLALCMSAVGASLPEFIMLKQVMQWRLLALFGGLLLVLFTCAGWLLNMVENILR